MTQEFFECWQAAGNHLNEQIPGGIQFWLRGHPYPPFLEHLSFRLGNQLFFIRIEDVNGTVQGPGNLLGLNAVAKGNNGHACLLPMKKRLSGEWVPIAKSGWGLQDAATGEPVDPFSLVTSEKIVMTNWEVQGMAVQIVRDHLDQKGYQLMSWQSNPAVDPSIWFVGDSQGPEWVVVRPAVYPQKQAERPANWQTIADHSARISSIGHFASVRLASYLQGAEPNPENVLPLWRGEAMDADFDHLG
jgi:hypothetical protein